MPCSVCNNTLQNLGLDQPGRRVFWCSNCGTLRWERAVPGGEPFVETDVPKGVRVLASDGPMSGEFDRWELEFCERNQRLKGDRADRLRDERNAEQAERTEATPENSGTTDAF